MVLTVARNRRYPAPFHTAENESIETSPRAYSCEMIGHGQTTRQIAARLHLSIKTVETYRAHIKDKLGLQDANELLRSAIQWVNAGLERER